MGRRSVLGSSLVGLKVTTPQNLFNKYRPFASY